MVIIHNFSIILSRYFDNLIFTLKLKVQGDTGIKLQYTHCRLHNLEKNSGAVSAKECIPEILEEPEVLILMKELARFHDVLYMANEQLESFILVQYLFHLW